MKNSPFTVLRLLGRDILIIGACLLLMGFHPEKLQLAGSNTSEEINNTLPTLAEKGPGSDESTNTKVYVSTKGVDSADCGGTVDNPCRTIGTGILRCKTPPCDVMVEVGTYTPSETIGINPGVNIIGGCYNGNKTAYQSRVICPPSGLPAFQVWNVNNLSETLISNFIISGATTKGINTTNVGIMVVNSGALVFRYVHIIGGNNLYCPTADCRVPNNFVPANGNPASGSSGGPAVQDNNGGGDGGFVRCEGDDPGPCKEVGKAAQAGGNYGGGGGANGAATAASCRHLANCTRQRGGSGGPGRNGSGGARGKRNNELKGYIEQLNSSYYFVSKVGSAGAAGAAGGGGGGGGGAGPCYTLDGYCGHPPNGGPPGGGGGSGGGSGVGGKFGQAGAASIGLWAMNECGITFDMGTYPSRITGGRGGNGQAGEDGGKAAPGGAGDIGLPYSEDKGSRGGNGGCGGGGGGGAGGNGGPSYGLLLDNSSQVVGLGLIFIAGIGGKKGKGGKGGIAPSSGSNGQSGEDGLDGLAKTYQYVPLVK